MPLLGIEHTWHAATARRRMGWASAALSPGDIVIMDNLGSHKSPAVRKAIREAGAKLKILLRKAAERTVEATWKRIGTLLNEFKPQERANYLKNSGYASN